MPFCREVTLWDGLYLTWARGAEGDTELAVLTGSGRCGGISDSISPEFPSFLEFLRGHPDHLLPFLPHHLPPPSLSAQAELPKIQPIPGLLSPEHAETGSTKVLERLCFTFCLQHLSPLVKKCREIISHLFFVWFSAKVLCLLFQESESFPTPISNKYVWSWAKAHLGSFLHEKQKFREGLRRESETKDRNDIYRVTTDSFALSCCLWVTVIRRML